MSTHNKGFDTQFLIFYILNLCFTLLLGLCIPAIKAVLTMVMWEGSQWLELKNVVQDAGKKNSRKAWIGALAAVMKPQLY